MEQIILFKTVKERRKGNKKMWHPWYWFFYALCGPILLFGVLVLLYGGVGDKIYYGFIPYSLRCQEGVLSYLYDIFYTTCRSLWDFYNFCFCSSGSGCIDSGHIALVNAFNALLVGWYLRRKTLIKERSPWWLYGIVAIIAFLVIIAIARFFWYTFFIVASILIIKGIL